MDANRIESALRRKNKKPIDNSTAIGTYCSISCDKFMTKGISNRDNARWKRAQYLIVTDCPTVTIQPCLNGFMQFAEPNQYIIFSQTDIVYNGRGKKMSFQDFLNSI